MREYGVTIPAELLADTKSEIYNSGLKVLLCSGISVVSTIIVSFLAAKIAAGFSHDLRDKVYNKVQNFSLNEIDSFSTSSLITRSTNDITQIQMVIVMVLRIAVSAPIMAIKGIIQATKQASSSNLNSIVIISVIALVLLVFIIFIFVMPKFKQIQGLTDKLNLVTRENLTGIRVVRANNAQGYEEEKNFSKVNNDVTKK
ncbi:MAG: ABC transporter ATP-binding protein [Clostridium sp.]|nr:MAG: ABC transporter ATP-binding protein [Clostridium sp.]